MYVLNNTINNITYNNGKCQKLFYNIISQTTVYKKALYICLLSKLLVAGLSL